MCPIRVLVADDHPIIRKSICDIFHRDGEIHVVGEATTGEEALALVETLTPDVLLLDVEMPGGDGVEVAKRLQDRESTTKILVLSAHDDLAYIQELMDCGVYGYLMKDEEVEVIKEAIRGVAGGEKGWMSQQISRRLKRWARGDEEGGSRLTPREKQVLRLVVQGKTNQEIAFHLNISDKTVEKYMSEILRKLDVNSRVEAAVLAVRGGLIH